MTDMSEFLAEVIGTMILMILGAGVVGGVLLKKSKAEEAGWVVITIGWGLAVALAVYAIGRVSDAHINPAVTLGLAAGGEFPWEKVPMYIGAQMIGAFLGAVTAYLNYLPHWKETDDPDLKRQVFSTMPQIRRPLANLLSEIIGTFILLLGILFIGANEFTQGWTPLLIGLLIASIRMSLVRPAAFAINPASDLAARIAHALLAIPVEVGSVCGYSWIAVVGPIIGGISGALFYKALFVGVLSFSFLLMSAVVL